MRKINKYTIAIDKLIFQCVGGLKPIDDLLLKGKKITLRKKIIVNEQVRLVRNHHSEYGFLHTFSVFFNDFICGEISYIVNGDLNYSIKKGLSLFICNNAFLYSENFNKNLINILHALGISIRKIDNLEIAIDGNGIIDKANTLLNIGNKGQWKPVSPKNKPKVAPDDLDEGYSSGIKYGKESTKKYVVFYPKSERLKEKQNKPYIEDYWNAGGLNTNLPIDRCEIKLNASRHTAGFSLNPEDWTKGYLMAFFKSKTENIFLFKNKKGVVKSIIDFSAIEHKKIYFSKRIYSPPNKIYSIRTTIKTLYKELGCFPCLAAYEELIKKYRLKSWFEEKRKRW